MTRLRDAHVVFVLAGEVLGGAERGAIDLATELRDDNGARVSILALDDRPGPARPFAEERGIDWGSARVGWEGSSFRRLRCLARFARAARRTSPDVLVSFTNAPNVFANLTRRATGASAAVWVQCDVGGTRRFHPWVFRRALHAAPVVVTAAHHAVRWLVEGYGADGARIRVVRSVVRVPEPREDGPAWRARLGIGPDDLVAVMLAHFHVGKDHPTVIRAWRTLADRLEDGPRPYLLLAGRDAGTLEESRRLVRELGLDVLVRFTGETPDVGGLLQAADLAVFASPSEMFPRAVSEPMAVGLPVVATDDPGTREAVGAPGAALIVAPGDHVALAENVLRLARDEQLRDGIGRASAELIRVRHARETSSGGYAELLDELLSANG